MLDVFRGLSERSRRLRFLGPKPRLSDDELARLVDVGCCGREAVTAVETATGRNVAVARFVRDEDGVEAEVAFAVVDEWQGRGLGRRLAAELEVLARRDGIERLRASVSVENEAAMALMRRLGPILSTRLEGAVYEVVVALP